MNLTDMRIIADRFVVTLIHVTTWQLFFLPFVISASFSIVGVCKFLDA